MKKPQTEPSVLNDLNTIIIWSENINFCDLDQLHDLCLILTSIFLLLLRYSS